MALLGIVNYWGYIDLIWLNYIIAYIIKKYRRDIRNAASSKLTVSIHTTLSSRFDNKENVDLHSTLLSLSTMASYSDQNKISKEVHLIPCCIMEQKDIFRHL